MKAAQRMLSAWRRFFFGICSVTGCIPGARLNAPGTVMLNSLDPVRMRATPRSPLAARPA